MDIGHNQTKKRQMALILTLLLIILFKIIGLRLIVVNGTSMEPTLHPYSVHIAHKTTITHLSTNDIIVLSNPYNDGYIIKRLVGLPNDTIKLSLGNLSINNVVIDNYKEIPDAYVEYTLEPNHIYIIGDNKYNSFDSKYYGAVDISNSVLYKLLI